MLRWDDAAVRDEAIRIARVSESTSAAARALSERFGEDVTKDALRHGWGRWRKRWPEIPPLTELLGLDVVPEPEPAPPSRPVTPPPPAALLSVARSSPPVAPARLDEPRRDDEPPPLKPHLAVTRGPAPAAAPPPHGVDLKRVLLVPDTHVPYEDPRAWQCMIQAARGWKPTHVVCLGDMADFYAVSAHDKDPRRTRDLTEEIRAVRARLAELEALGADEYTFCAGNHEDRLSRYLMTRAPELFGLVKIEEALELAAHGWRYVPYRQHATIGKLHVTHDLGSAGQYAHYRTLAAMGACVAFGHTHRLGVAYEGTERGEHRVGAMLGWLGDLEHADYAHRAQKRFWQLGFGVAYVEPNGVAHLHPVPIVDYRCVVAGQLYQA